jgi:hypothetical protein
MRPGLRRTSAPLIDSIDSRAGGQRQSDSIGSCRQARLSNCTHGSQLALPIQHHAAVEDALHEIVVRNDRWSFVH